MLVKKGKPGSLKLLDMAPELQLKVNQKNLASTLNLRPMGSNFNDIVPNQGITVAERGKVKHGNLNLSIKNEMKLSLEDYNSIKQNTSLS